MKIRLFSPLSKASFPSRKKGSTSFLNPSFFHYLVAAFCGIIFAGLSSALYTQVILKANKNLAYSTASTPIHASHYLSFQGRLTDSSGNPITVSTPIYFKLFDTETMGTGTSLYVSSTGNSQAVTPDTNGIFSVIIGKTHGIEIPISVFSENPSVFLEVTAGGETMSPRQQIATVGYAQNSETLQGLPPSSSGTKNTVMVIDSLGNLNLGETSPTIQSISGTFGIKGQAVLLDATNSLSNSNIKLDPVNPNGSIQLNTNGTGSSNAIVATNANLSAGNLFYGNIGNENQGYNFINFSNISPITHTLVSRFTVSAGGSVNVGATLNSTNISIGSTLINSSASEINLLKGLISTNGSIVIGNGSSLSNLNVGASGYVLVSNGTTPTWVSNSSVGTAYIAGSGLTMAANVFKLGGPLTENARLNIGNTEVMFLKFSNGNVGIGTTSPLSKLHLIDSAATTGTIFQIGSSSVTSGQLIRLTQNNSTMTGTGLYMDLGIGSTATFTGNFLDLRNNTASVFNINYRGGITQSYTTPIAGLGASLNNLTFNNTKDNATGYYGLSVAGNGTTVASSTGTGTTEPMADIYEGFRFNTGSYSNISGVSFRFKKNLGTTTPNTGAYVRAYLYASTGSTSPAAASLATSTIIYLNQVTTAFANYTLNLGATGLPLNTDYWIVLRRVNMDPNDITFEGSNVGTTEWANSTDGVTWTSGVSTFKANYTVYTQSASGVYGSSYSGYGLYGSSTQGYGVRGSSTNSYGIYGTSTYSLGGIFSSGQGLENDLNSSSANAIYNFTQFQRNGDRYYDLQYNTWFTGNAQEIQAGNPVYTGYYYYYSGLGTTFINYSAAAAQYAGSTYPVIVDPSDYFYMGRNNSTSSYRNFFFNFSANPSLIGVTWEYAGGTDPVTGDCAWTQFTPTADETNGLNTSGMVALTTSGLTLCHTAAAVGATTPTQYWFRVSAPGGVITPAYATASNFGMFSGYFNRFYSSGIEKYRINYDGNTYSAGVYYPGTNAGEGSIQTSRYLYDTGSALGTNSNFYVSGNLGIGITPTYKLHVSGDALISTRLGIGATSPAYNLFISSLGLGVTGNSVFSDNLSIGKTLSAASLNIGGTMVIDSNKFFYAPNGTVTTPGYSFITDTNSGLYHPTADNLSLNVGSVEALRILASGNVGIGTTNPGYKLDVNGTLRTTGAVYTDTVTSNSGYTKTSSSNLLTMSQYNENALGFRVPIFVERYNIGTSVWDDVTGSATWAYLTDNRPSSQIQLSTLQVGGTEVEIRLTYDFGSNWQTPAQLLGLNLQHTSNITYLKVEQADDSAFATNPGTLLENSSTTSCGDCILSYPTSSLWRRYLRIDLKVNRTGGGVNDEATLREISYMSPAFWGTSRLMSSMIPMDWDQNRNVGFTGSINTSIGITTPRITMTTGAAANRILQSDASGNASWVNAAGIGGTYAAGVGLTLSSNNVFSLNLGSTNTWLGPQTFSANSYFPSGIWNTSGSVGIGTTSPQSKLDIQGNANLNYTGSGNFNSFTLATSTGDTNVSVTGISTQIFNTANSNSGTSLKYGLLSSYTKNGTGTNTGYQNGAGWFASSITGGTETTLDNVNSRIQVPAGGMVINATDFSADTSYASGGVITNRNGFQVRDFLQPVANQYGLYINNLSAGTTNNFSIYTGTAKSYFGGSIGIGTTAPGAYKLNVVGNAYFSGNLQIGGTFIGDGSGLTNIAVSSLSFDKITSGTNVGATMVIGAGASLSYAGTGLINASQLQTATWASPLAIGNSIANTAIFSRLGIGSSSASYLFNVAGNGNLTGALNVGVSIATTTIYSSGSIGIGNTATGAYKLNVTGDSYFSGNLSVGGTLIGDASGLTRIPFNQIISGTNVGATMVVGTGASLYTSGNGVINASQLLGLNWITPGAIGSSTPNTGKFTSLWSNTLGVGYTAISTGVAAFNGNLGIFTTSPSFALSVGNSGGIDASGNSYSSKFLDVGNTRYFSILSNSDPNKNSLSLYSTGSIKFNVNDTATNAYLLTGAASRIQNFTNGLLLDVGTSNSGNITWNNTLFLNTAGSVGIGTTNPLKKVDLVGDLNISGTIFVGGSGTSIGVTGAVNQVLASDGNGSLKWINGGSAYAGSGLNLDIGSSFNLGGLITRDANLFVGSSGSPSIFIQQSTGNVGIGTSNPTTGMEVFNPAAFDAAGDVEIGYNLNFSNDTASYIRSQSPLYIEAGDPNSAEDLVLRSRGSGNVVIGNSTTFLQNSSEVLQISNSDSSYALFGPNSSWGGYLRVGSGLTNHASGNAAVSSTNGNLHLDAGTGQYTYLNYYAGSGVYFGSGASGLVGSITSAGRMDIGSNSGNGGYVSSGNYGGTGSAAYMPSGIWANGPTNWLYGTNNFNGTLTSTSSTWSMDNSGNLINSGTISGNSNVYTNGWFRTYNRLGLYSETQAIHFYPDNASYWAVSSNNGLKINSTQAYDSAVAGYLYHDASGFGLLGNAGSWALQIPPGGNAISFPGHVGIGRGADASSMVAISNGSYNTYINESGIGGDRFNFYVTNNNNGAVLLQTSGTNKLIINPTTTTQSSVKITAANGTSVYEDWPAGWTGGLATWDVNVASIQWSGTRTRSDMRLKQDIQSLDSTTLDSLRQIQPVSFYWKDTRINTQKQFGFIAQAVQPIFPNLVSESTDDQKTLSMDYMAFIPLLTLGFQDVDSRVSSVSAQLKDISITATGQVNINYNVSPEVLASLGYTATLNELQSANYTLKDSIGNLVDRIAQFKEMAAAKINTGLLIATNIVSDRVISKTSISQETKTNLISPLSSDDHTIIIAADASISGKLTANSIESQDASISGTLYADNIISKDGSITDLMSQKIASLRDELKKIVNDSLTTGSDIGATSPLLADSSSWSSDIKNDSMNLTGDLSLDGNLMVKSQATIKGVLIAGSIAFKDNFIETADTALYLQPSGTGSVHVLGDTLVIADTGDVTINGNLDLNGALIAQTASFSGSLFASLIKTHEISTDKISVSTDSAQTIIAESGFAALATSSAKLSSNATAGTVTLPAGKTEIVIQNNKLTSQSMVYLTPVGSTQNQVVYVKSKFISPTPSPIIATDSAAFSPSTFVIALDKPLSSNIDINWWIIN